MTDLYKFVLGLGAVVIVLDLLFVSPSPKVEVSKPSAEETKQGEEELARVIFIKMSLGSLQKETSSVVMPKSTYEHLLKQAKRLKDVVDEKKSDAAFNDTVHKNIVESLATLKAHQERYEKILQALQNDEVMRATQIAGMQTPEALVTKMYEEEPSTLALFFEKKCEISEGSLTKALEEDIKRLTKQHCIAQEEVLNAQHIVSFLEQNLQSAQKETLLSSLHQQLASLQTVAKKSLLDDSMDAKELKQLYIEAIKFNCTQTLEQLFTCKECETFLNEPIEVTEKPIGLRRYETNSYTPIEFARRYAHEKTYKIIKNKFEQ
jgi:sulfur relay (sulfurtransferase) DsrF/TusC family protein